MNVTTSINWNRPAVGIIRVERALCAELAMLFPSTRFRECFWQNGAFIARGVDTANFQVKQEAQNSDLSASVEVSTNSSPNPPGRFTRFVALLRGSTEYLGVSNLDGDEEEDQVSPASDNRSGSDPFVPGDVLISVGLEWDYPYHKQFYRLRKERGIRIVTCCYDLIPVLYPQYCVGDVASHFKQYFLDSAWGSDAILCISKQSERDLKKMLFEVGAAEPRTCVIALGDNVPSGSGVISDTVADITKSPFLLFVSTIERRKNHEVLYRAYHLLCEKGKWDSLPKLVFVGMPGWGVGDFLKDSELDPLTKGLIVQLNNVNDAELRLLYENALFCVYPSFYEGWGLPVGEALALGKAVLSSDRGSLPEVGGDLVQYVDPWNPAEWAEAIWHLVSSPEQLKSLTERVNRAYRPRQWDGTAATVKLLIDDLVTLPRDIELWPGHTMSTEVGEKIGAVIRSSGLPGYLMYGPHWGLDSGCYRVTVWDIRSERETGSATFDVVSNLGNVVHWSRQLEIEPERANDFERPLLDFSVNLSEPVEYFQIRCKIKVGALSLWRLRVRQILDEKPLNDGSAKAQDEVAGDPAGGLQHRS